MNSLPILYTPVISADALTLTLRDNTLTSTGTLAGILVYMSKMSDLSLIRGIRLTGPQQTDILGAGVDLEATLWGYATTFDDGVHKIRYYRSYTTAATLTFTEGEKMYTMAGGAPATIFENGAVGFILTGGEDNKIYYLDNTKAVTATTGYVTENLPLLSGAQAIEIVFEGSSHFYTALKGDNCLQADIATWADRGCNGNDYCEIQKRLLYLEAVAVKYAKGHYLDADMLIDKLVAYCEEGACGCN